MHARLVIGCALAALGRFSVAALGQTEPIWTDRGLLFPEGAAIPRSLTQTERAYWDVHPRDRQRGAFEPPSGPVFCPGEYAPMQAILIAWEGDSSWKSILAQMAGRITTTGDADLWVVLDTASEQSNASSTLSAAGANLSRVSYLVRQTDTIWCRDYGPRYIYEGNCRAIVDHIYNRNRPFDDVLPAYIAQTRNHAIYDLDLVHGGGNFHLDSIGRSYVTRLVTNENPDKTEQEIHDLWAEYQNVDTTFFNPYSQAVDSTQHIDMWMQVIDDDKVIVSDWPLEPGSQQDNIADGAAATLATRGYTVYRIPAVRSGGTHYTFTNVVLCNGIVMIPSYTNPTASQYNDDALAVFQNALPSKTIYQIPSQAIVTAAGVLHCIVMHIPEPLGGVHPTAYLKNLRGGEALTPGEVVDIRWISDDDQAVTSVDLKLSTNGGASYDWTIVHGTAADGLYSWTVPDLDSAQARIQVVVHDASGNSGSDASDSNFTIGSPSCTGDVNGDGTVDLGDLSLLLAAFGTCSGDGNYNPSADLDGSGCVDLSDLSELLAAFGLDCP